MKVAFVAGFGPIIREADAAHAFWRDGLGIKGLGDGNEFHPTGRRAKAPLRRRDALADGGKTVGSRRVHAFALFLLT